MTQPASYVAHAGTDSERGTRLLKALAFVKSKRRTNKARHSRHKTRQFPASKLYQATAQNLKWTGARVQCQLPSLLPHASLPCSLLLLQRSCLCTSLYWASTLARPSAALVCGKTSGATVRLAVYWWTSFPMVWSLCPLHSSSNGHAFAISCTVSSYLRATIRHPHHDSFHFF